MTVTERVSHLLREKGIQQKDLCKAINYSKSRLSYTLSKNRDFTADDVIGIASCLGISVNYLLTGTEDAIEETPPVIEKFTEDELELLNLYRSVDHECKTTILYTAYQQRGRYKAFTQEKSNLNQTA